MDRYEKVESAKAQAPKGENEMRITSLDFISNYINYATAFLQGGHGREVVLTATGQAISKTVAIAEILKRRFPRLHQDIAVGSVCIKDVWEPIEEGLLPVETNRRVSMISITLSTKGLNKNSPGYQAPPKVEQARKVHSQQYQQQQPRRARPIYGEDSYGRVRGQARGGGRLWGPRRGGYGNYQGNYRGIYEGNNQGYYYQDNGGYSNWGRGGGGGAGYGYRGAGYGRGRARGGGRGYHGSYGGVDGYTR